MAEANANTVTVVTESRNLKIAPFSHADDQISTGNGWQDWIEDIERQFRFFKITDAQDKQDASIIFGGKEMYSRLAQSLPDPAEGDVYTKLKDKPNTYMYYIVPSQKEQTTC